MGEGRAVQNGVLEVLERSGENRSPTEAIKVNTRDCSFRSFPSHMLVDSLEELVE